MRRRCPLGKVAGRCPSCMGGGACPEWCPAALVGCDDAGGVVVGDASAGVVVDRTRGKGGVTRGSFRGQRFVSFVSLMVH